MAAVRSAVLPDAEATAALAAALAATAPPGAVVHLEGDLGAGKSTLARAWLRALGVTGPVRSPTYTLVERYPLATGGEALHLDLYRIGDAGELEFLGLDDADPAVAGRVARTRPGALPHRPGGLVVLGQGRHAPALPRAPGCMVAAGRAAAFAAAS